MANILLVACSDDRLDEAIGAFAKRLKGENNSCYTIRVFGSSLSLMDGEYGQMLLALQLGAALRLGPIKRVVIMHHEECRYCANHQFVNTDMELDFHQAQMSLALDFIAKTLSTIQHGDGEPPQFDVAYAMKVEQEFDTDYPWAVQLASEIVYATR